MIDRVKLVELKKKEGRLRGQLLNLSISESARSNLIRRLNTTVHELRKLSAKLFLHLEVSGGRNGINKTV